MADQNVGCAKTSAHWGVQIWCENRATRIKPHTPWKTGKSAMKALQVGTKKPSRGVRRQTTGLALCLTLRNNKHLWQQQSRQLPIPVLIGNQTSKTIDTNLVVYDKCLVPHETKDTEMVVCSERQNHAHGQWMNQQMAPVSYTSLLSVAEAMMSIQPLKVAYKGEVFLISFTAKYTRKTKDTKMMWRWEQHQNFW